MDELKAQLLALLPGTKKPPRVSGDELAIFTRQMAAMLSSGIPLHHVLEFYADSDEGDLAEVINDIAFKVSTGHTFSRAMRNYPDIFSQVYIGLAETGEQSGQILTTFNRLADLLEKNTSMRKKVIATVTYPTILLIVSMVAIAGFVYFVLPMMVPLFESLAVDLPLPTRILLMSRYVLPATLAILALLALLGWLGKPWLKRFFKNNPEVRKKLHSIPLGIPVVGNLTEKIITARILYAMATMLDAGLSMVPTIRRAGTVAGNAVIEERMIEASREIMDGHSVHEAMGMHNVFPIGAIQMLSVGEESADLTKMVRHVASFYDSEVELALNDIAAIIEPIIMIVMGVVVGFIVLSAILPTVKLLDQL